MSFRFGFGCCRVASYQSPFTTFKSILRTFCASHFYCFTRIGY